MINEKFYADYLNGSLDEKSIELFNIRLKNEQEFREGYENYVKIKRATLEIQKDKMRSDLDEVNIEDLKPTSKKGLNIKPLYKIFGAVAAVFLGVVLFMQISNSNSPGENLFAKNFDVYTQQNARSQGGNANDKDFYSLNPQRLSSPDQKLWYASNLMDNDQIVIAQIILSDIDDNSAVRDQKYWYLGLGYLKLNQPKEAKVAFKKLTTMSNYKKKEIAEILEKI